jgi:hypothetical protein
MHISFIRPNMFAARSRDALEPVVFAILRGLTPGDVESSLFDEPGRNPLADDVLALRA